MNSSILQLESSKAVTILDQLLWKALRCSSAAPTYFSSVDNKFVDGGLAANNPMVEVLTEIQRYNNALEYSVSRFVLDRALRRERLHIQPALRLVTTCS